MAVRPLESQNSSYLLPEEITRLNPSLDFAYLVEQAEQIIAERNSLRAEFRSKKFTHDQGFLDQYKGNLEALSHRKKVEKNETLVWRVEDFLHRIAAFLYQQKDGIIADFCSQFKDGDPGHLPLSSEILNYIFEINKEGFSTFIPKYDLERLSQYYLNPAKYIFEIYANQRDFDFDRPVNIGNQDSIKTFYGQLLHVAANFPNHELNSLKSCLNKLEIPNLNLARLDLKAYPKLATELNIHAIRKTCELESMSVVKEKESSQIVFEKQFADFIAQSYREFPETTLPESGDKASQVYEKLKLIYKLQNSALCESEKGDPELLLQIAFNLRNQIEQSL